MMSWPGKKLVNNFCSINPMPIAENNRYTVKKPITTCNTTLLPALRLRQKDFHWWLRSILITNKTLSSENRTSMSDV